MSNLKYFFKGKRPRKVRAKRHRRLSSRNKPTPITLYQKLSLIISFLGIISLFFIGAQTYLIFEQNAKMAEQNTKMTKNMQASMHSTITIQTLEMDKIFLANPEIRPYFYDGWEVPDEKKNARIFNKIMIIAEYQLDYFDLVMTQQDYLPVDQDTEEDRNNWTEYFKDSFAESPALCKRLNANPEWYMPRLVMLAKTNCKRID